MDNQILKNQYIHPGKNDCLTHLESSGILILDNSIAQKKMIPEKNFESATLKKVNIPNLPPGKIYLEIETPGKITIRGPPGFLHPYPCMDKME